MTTKLLAAVLGLLGLLGIFVTPNARSEDSTTSLLKSIEPRLRAIYEEGEFRTKRFEAVWLPDSSGYTVMESGRRKEERVPVFYDAATGDRKVLEPTVADTARQSGTLSPDENPFSLVKRETWWCWILKPETPFP